MPERLILPASLRNRLEALAQEGYPQEACGLLVGALDDCGARRISRVVPVRNVNRQRPHDRYLLDPEDHFRAEEEARRDGLDIIGVWHSHPDRSARASETDRANAWEGWSYLIASVHSGGVSDLRAFCLAGSDFVEQEIVS